MVLSNIIQLESRIMKTGNYRAVLRIQCSNRAENSILGGSMIDSV